MTDTILVNLHCHSLFSDGELTPEALAANLAAAGVRYAALTDHDSLGGLPRFQEALQKRGVAYLPGVELTTQFHGREAHLLGYGFDPHHADLDATLFSLRQARNLEVHSIAGSLRRIGANRPGDTEIRPASAPRPTAGWRSARRLLCCTAPADRCSGRIRWSTKPIRAAGCLRGGTESAGAGWS